MINKCFERLRFNKKRLLGICLGMQVLLTRSYEMGNHSGLDFINGELCKLRIKQNQKLKISYKLE